MGESKGNLRSAQFKGQMPEHIISGSVQIVVGIDEAWLAANPAPELGPPIHVPDDVQVVEYRLIGVMAKPSRLVPPDQWPMTQVDLGVVKRLTVAEFKALAAPSTEEKGVD